MSEIISVIIPSYNRKNLVTEAIDSVLNQTRLVGEIIVVDDGSTDETAAVLAQYGNRIAVVRQENSGVNSARNNALNMATGAYVALLDSDDVWLPFKTALQVAALEKFPDAGFVFSDFFVWRPGVLQQAQGLRSWHRKRHTWSDIFAEKISGGKLSINGKPMGHEDVDVYRGDIYSQSLAEPFVLPSTAIIRRECLGELRFDSADSTCGDWSFFSRLSKKQGAVYVDRETTLNRSHDDEVRLTRLDQRMQLERQLAMTRDVWGSDSEFERDRPGESDKMVVTLLHKLAKLELKSGRPGHALAFLDQATSLGISARYSERLMLRMLSSAPRLLALAKWAKRMRQSHNG